MTWPTVKLSAVLADVKSGFAYGEDASGGVLQFRMNNVTREGGLDFTKTRRVPASIPKLDTFVLEPGDVLFNATNSPELVGKTAFFPGLGERVVFSNHFLRLRPRSNDLDGRFLSRWLTFEYLRGTFEHMCRRWVNQATVGRDSLLTLSIPLPPLSEQRRIAEILDRADAVRSVRRAAIAKFDGLPAAVFKTMFGDPVTNPRDWPRFPLGELLGSIDSGWSPKCLDRPAAAGEWAVLKLGAVTRCEYDAAQNKALMADATPRRELEVNPGDVLFTRKNTHKLVAACAFVWDTPPHLLMPDLIFRLRPGADAPIDPVFLQQLLAYPSKRREIQKLAGGSAGSMPNISKARLATALIELPPLDVQREFRRKLEAVRALRTACHASRASLDALFASLQDRALQGQL